MELGRPWMMRGLVIALALVVGVVAWMATRGDGGESTPGPSSNGSESRVVTEAELKDVAALADHPVYWAGPAPGAELELTEGPEGSVQLRYLEEGDEAGEGPAESLTVGTYPLPDADGALDAFAKRRGSVVRRSRDGRKVVVSKGTPTSAYFVSPDDSVQVEVYDPSPKRALGLALSVQVRPVG